MRVRVLLLAGLLAASACGSGDATPNAPEDASAPAIWSPSSSAPVSYYWQLSTTFDPAKDLHSGAGPAAYDLDGETNDAASVRAIHASGTGVVAICYVDVGTWESYRSDADSFPRSLIGNPNGWPGEKWLDVRNQAVLLPLMKKRILDWCVAKGFDAVEPDNLDGWQNDPGFPITAAENLAYDRAIAKLVHELGLSVGQKNLPESAATLEPDFDWALNEQCYQFGECHYFEDSFIAKGKAVFDVEYDRSPDCADANARHLNAQRRDLDLVGPGGSGYRFEPCVMAGRRGW